MRSALKMRHGSDQAPEICSLSARSLFPVDHGSYGRRFLGVDCILLFQGLSYGRPLQTATFSQDHFAEGRAHSVAGKPGTLFPAPAQLILGDPFVSTPDPTKVGNVVKLLYRLREWNCGRSRLARAWSPARASFRILGTLTERIAVPRCLAPLNSQSLQAAKRI